MSARLGSGFASYFCLLSAQIESDWQPRVSDCYMGYLKDSNPFPIPSWPRHAMLQTACLSSNCCHRNTIAWESYTANMSLSSAG